VVGLVVYYDRDPVRITSEAVRVAGRSYPLAELSQVWQRRAGRSWRVLLGRGMLAAMILGPLVAAAVGFWLAARLELALTGTAALVTAACLVGVAAGPVADLLLDRMDRSYLAGAYELELWVRWQGRPVRLLSSRDALRFGQIYRALGRALEQREPTGERP
jgi:hypothetical protein